VRSRLTILALAVAAIAASTAPAHGATTACRAAHLRGQLNGTSGAAGTILLSITLTNRGAPCTLHGYTRLQLMASARSTLPTHVVHGGLSVISQKPKTILLGRGSAASVLIAYSDVPHGSEHTCPAGTEILVRVPGDATWLPVLAPTNACAHGTLEESPLLSGRRKAT
jgi:hypothetical protein